MEKFYSIDIAKPSDAKAIVDFFNARGFSLNSSFLLLFQSFWGLKALLGSSCEANLILIMLLMSFWA
jgi:hypothetical protein